MDDIKNLDDFPGLNHNNIGVCWPRTMPRAYCYLSPYRMDKVINPNKKKAKRVAQVIKYTDATIEGTFWMDDLRCELFTKMGVLIDGELSPTFIIINEKATEAWNKLMIPAPQRRVVESEVDTEEEN